MTAPLLGQKRTKSRNGCVECKTRRRKCDETKPGCLQCQRHKKQCPGYQRSFRWSTKYEVLNPELRDSSRSKRERVKSDITSSSEARRANSFENTPSNMGPSLPKRQQSSDDPTAEEVTTKMDPDSDFHQENLVWLSDKLHADATEVLHNPSANVDIPKLTLETQVSARATPESTSPISPQTCGSGRSASPWAASAVPPPVNPGIAFSASLVDFWFAEAHRMYSIYDPGILEHYTIAMETHWRSEAVFLALQCMSAAYLRNSFPQARAVLSGLIARTLTTIRREIAEFFHARAFIHAGIPVEPIFATFSLGAAMLWMKSRNLAATLRKKVTQMLNLSRVDCGSLDCQDREKLAFFQQLLTQWESSAAVPQASMHCWAGTSMHAESQCSSDSETSKDSGITTFETNAQDLA